MTVNFSLSAQNTFFVGNSTYESTAEYELLSDEQIGGENLNVMIAKNGNAGFFIVSTDLYFDHLRIKGKLLIYLDDKTVITCTDKGKYDYVNNTATAIYHLTEGEIRKLQNSNIFSIRFSIGSIYKDSYGSTMGAHSVRNHPNPKFFINNERIDFPSIINGLYN